MVSDCQIFIAVSPRCFSHLENRVSAVGDFGMAMEVAADIIQFNQTRYFVILGSIYFPTVFAQLRRNPLEPQFLVYLSFGCARQPAFSFEEPVFVQLPFVMLYQLAQCDIVGLGPGEIHKRSAEGLWLEKPEIHLEPATQLYGHALGAAAEDAFDARIIQDRFGCCGPV